MKISNLVLILIPFLFPHLTSALSLDEMQKAALGNRALIKRYQTEVEKSGQDIRIAKSGYYPSLDLLYNSYTLNEDTNTERTENSIFSGTVRWNIFSGFKDRYSVNSAELLKDVETNRLHAIEQDIQLSVALRYLAVYNQQARLKVARDSYKTLEGLYTDSLNRYEVGLLDKNEVLKFKVDFANANLAVQSEEAALLRTVNDLAREVNLQINRDELEFTEFKQPPILTDRDTYEQEMLDNRSELKVLEGLSESSKMQVKVRYGNYYPRFDLVGRYRNYDDSLLNGTGEFTNEELRTELVLSYNLFNGYSDEAEIAKAKAEVRSVQYDLAELRESLKTDLRNLFVDYQVSLANVEVAREDIAYAEENLRITRLKYQEGLQRQLDLLDAVANLTRAQSNYVTVVRVVFEKYFQIMRMVEAFPVKQ